MMFQDPTAIAVAGGTGIYGWRLDDPPLIAPEITTGPVYAQYPMVGAAQSYTQSVVSANPAATVAVQWMRDGVAIVGATGATYTPVVGDIGGRLSVHETWTNVYGSASAESEAWLVTPAMNATNTVAYIDPTLGADDGGPYAEGATYDPSFLLADGSASPSGKIYSTCKAAYDAAAGDGHRYYLRKGYFHDPVSGVFFNSLFTRSDTLFSAYGPASASLPILDGVVYLSDATGWTPNGTISGAWDYALTGVTANNANLKGRLWVGRKNEGNLTSQRPSGTGRRRAASSLSNLSLTNSSANAGLWYITAGSPSILTVMADVGTAPPVYWDGIGLVIENFSSNPSRGIVFRNGASRNRVEYLEVQGTNFKPLGIVGFSTDSTCDGNAFVNVGVRSFIGNALNLEGPTAARTVTNTYISNMTAVAQSNAFECEAGSNDFLNLNPWSFGGWVNTVYCYDISYEGHNTHTACELTLLLDQPPSNVYFDGVDVNFLPGATDGRAGGGFLAGGYFRNFTITNAPARTQFVGTNFEIAYGTVIDDGTNTNKTASDQFQSFKFVVDTYDPAGTTTANLSIHDVEFNLAASSVVKAPFWFDGYDSASLSAPEQPAANAVSIYNCRATLSATQGFVVRGVNAGSRPDPWPDQNIHDNVVVNTALVGQNFSATNSQSLTPIYTSQLLNGFFGCSANQVVAA